MVVEWEKNAQLRHVLEVDPSAFANGLPLPGEGEEV